MPREIYSNGERIIFQDENAWIAWNTMQQVNEIAQSIPPEAQELKTQLITFSPEYQQRGLHAVYAAGTVIGTGIEGTQLIPERTLNILDELEIPYQVVQRGKLDK